MSEIEYWKAWLSTVWRLGRSSENERGEITQTVIIIAILAAAAIAICTLIVVKFTSKANTIPTG